MSPEITVLGSLNQDLTIRVPHHPAPGETVLGSEHFTGAGGKGANQAAAAGRLGRSVAMIGRVGDDEPGRFLLDSLANDGVATSRVTIDKAAGPGVAVITLDDDAENSIVVSPGANARVGVGDIGAARPQLTQAAITLIQLEVPLDAVAAAIGAAEGMVILNPAPAVELAQDMLDLVDVLVPNRSELALLTGAAEPRSPDEAVALAIELHGPGTVVVTLGAEGAVIVSEGNAAHVPAPQITPVDTTGSGDSFCGDLADALARGEDMADAVRWAVNAGAVAATRSGALASLPTADEVQALMSEGSM